MRFHGKVLADPLAAGVLTNRVSQPELTSALAGTAAARKASSGSGPLAGPEAPNKVCMRVATRDSEGSGGILPRACSSWDRPLRERGVRQPSNGCRCMEERHAQPRINFSFGSRHLGNTRRPLVGAVAQLEGRAIALVRSWGIA